MKFVVVLMIGSGTLAACEAAPPVNLNDGYNHISGGGTFNCTGPTSVDGSHKDVVLQGSCRRIRVTGSHDDVVAYVEPSSTVEVTGSHVDVVYRLVRRGPAPQWLNRGDGNDLVRNSHAPWEQDHDWFQEQH